jgi:hypothetical protein
MEVIPHRLMVFITADETPLVLVWALNACILNYQTLGIISAITSWTLFNAECILTPVFVNVPQYQL